MELHKERAGGGAAQAFEALPACAAHGSACMCPWLPLCARRTARRGACRRAGARTEVQAWLHACRMARPAPPSSWIPQIKLPMPAMGGWRWGEGVVVRAWSLNEHKLKCPCAPTPSSLLRPSSHGVSQGGVQDARAAVAHGIECAALAATPFRAHDRQCHSHSTPLVAHSTQLCSRKQL